MKKSQLPQMALLIAALSIGSAGIAGDAFARDGHGGGGKGSGGHSHGSTVGNSHASSGGSANAMDQRGGSERAPVEAVRKGSVAPAGSAAGPDDPNDFPSVW